MTILEDGCCAVVPEVRGWGGGMRWGVASLSTASTFGVRHRWRSAGITIKNPLKLLGAGRKNTSRGNRGGKHRVSNKHCPSLREGMQLPCDGLMGGIKRGQERNKEGLTARVRRPLTKGFHA